MQTWLAQSGYGVRFDWGTAGADALHADVSVVIDVLSFTTTLSVALDRGMEVVPYPSTDGTAFARRHGATLAAPRSRAGPGDISLSPWSVRKADPPARLVLPSPNGSTIAHRLAGGTCLGACLRNAGAVADWIAEHSPDATVAVVAAGERWPDGSLRPAAEDLWGAGAVIDGLARRGRAALSPEAELARSAYLAVRGREWDGLRRCVGGVELIAGGYGGDVDIAAEVDASSAVPLLVGEIFTDAVRPRGPE